MNKKLSSNTKEIGNSTDSIHLEYAEIEKYAIKEEKTLFSKIRFYYLRNKYLITIQFIYQKEKDFGSSDEDTFIYPEPHAYFGPHPSLFESKCIVDKIILNLAQNEHIYNIKGFFDEKSKKITNFCVQTTRGNFIDFGPSEDYNFHWDFYYNKKFFDGFIVGWNDSSINYLASILIDKEKTEEPEETEELTDVTFTQGEMKNFLPIIQTGMFGTFLLDETRFYDPYSVNDIIPLLRENKIYLSNIIIHYSSSITKIDIRYSYVEPNQIENLNSEPSRKTLSCSYTAALFDAKKNKKMDIVIEKGEIINGFSVMYGEFIGGLKFMTSKGKQIRCDLGSFTEEKR